jgi:hypothetical protein
MSLFFVLNLFASLIIVNGLIRVFTLQWEPSAYLINVTSIVLVLVFVYWRGRYSLLIRNNSLIINNFPFSRKIALTQIQDVTLQHKAVHIKTLDGKEITVKFVFGPESAVHPKVNRMITEQTFTE